MSGLLNTRKGFLPRVSRSFAGSGAAWLARLPWEQEVDGSNPSSPIGPQGQTTDPARL